RVPARPGRRAHLLPLGPAATPTAPVPLAVRRQDDPGRCAAARADVRIRRPGPAALVADLGRPCQWSGRDAGVFAVRQSNPAGYDLRYGFCGYLIAGPYVGSAGTSSQLGEIHRPITDHTARPPARLRPSP